MTLQTEKKDRLELLLDDFTDVHGTVLLGMHRELLSLKEDIDDRLESRISQALAPINAADTELQAQIEAARQVVAALEEKTGRAAATFAAAREQLVKDIASVRESLGADYLRMREELGRHGEVLPTLERGVAEFATKQGEALAEIAAGRSDLQLVLAQIGNQRSTFEQEIARAVARITALQQEHQEKMSATLKVTDKLNGDSRALLRSFRKRIDALKEREAAVQKRQRVEISVIGLLGLLMLAISLWQTLPR
jgi:hypothetical protein